MSITTCPYCGRVGEWIEANRMETKHYCLGCGHEWKINHYRWLGTVALLLAVAVLCLGGFLLGGRV